MKLFIRKLNADHLGMTASISCAIHCALLPTVATSLPLMGLEFMANIWVEMFMIAFSFFVAVFALVKAFPKHQSYLPILLVLAGFVSIALGHFLLHKVEHLLIPLGGFTIAFAHYLNWKKANTCHHKINI